VHATLQVMTCATLVNIQTHTEMSAHTDRTVTSLYDKLAQLS